MTASILAVVLAAGEGTRMRSSLPKVLHKVGGLPMLGHVLGAVRAAGADKIALVVGNGSQTVASTAKSLAPGLDVYVQEERLGTGHAVLAARAALIDADGAILIAYGDTPLVTPGLFKSILECLDEGADVSVMGFETGNPKGYGRLIMSGDRLARIREEKDASDAERRITFCNSGLMGLKAKHALPLLDAIGNANAKGEYYLTDIVEIANARGLVVRAVTGPEEDTLGVNNRAELAKAEAIFQNRKRQAFMMAGVTLIAPETVYFAHDTEIGVDCVIEPNCFFAPGVRLESGVHIKANCYLEGDTGKNLLVSVASGAEIGPYARLRPGADIGEDVKVGNFCEVKNAHVARGAKINHLTYIGDADLGEYANIGAGTITCNYDGFSKFRTVIGANAFIGSNSALVAPVTIGAGAFVGSGSVITDNVSENALAVGRGRQVEKAGWANHFRDRNRKI